MKKPKYFGQRIRKDKGGIFVNLPVDKGLVIFEYQFLRCKRKVIIQDGATRVILRPVLNETGVLPHLTLILHWREERYLLTDNFSRFEEGEFKPADIAGGYIEFKRWVAKKANEFITKRTV